MRRIARGQEGRLTMQVETLGCFRVQANAKLVIDPPSSSATLVNSLTFCTMTFPSSELRYLSRWSMFPLGLTWYRDPSGRPSLYLPVRKPAARALKMVLYDGRSISNLGIMLTRTMYLPYPPLRQRGSNSTSNFSRLSMEYSGCSATGPMRLRRRAISMACWICTGRESVQISAKSREGRHTGSPL